MLKYLAISEFFSSSEKSFARLFVVQAQRKGIKTPPCEICRKVFWTSVLSLLVVEAIVLIPSFRNELSALRAECMRQGEQALSSVKLGIQHIASRNMTSEFFATALQIESVYSIAIYDQQRNILSRFGSDAPRPAIFDETTADSANADFKNEQPFGENMLITGAVERSGELYYISVALDGSHIQAEVWQYVLRVMAAIVAICFCVSGSLAVIMRRYSRKLQHQAFHDSDTGLPNRAGTERYLRHAIENHQNFHLIAFDLDSFHVIKERWGPDNSEIFLSQVVHEVEKKMSNDAWLGRFREDYFGIILPAEKKNGDENSRDIQGALANLQAALDKSITVETTTMTTTACVGVVTYYADSELTAEDVMVSVDLAVRSAKAQGPNRVVHYSRALADEQEKHISVISRLRVALAEERLSLVYQPQYVANTVQLSGAESLMRWNDPEIGSVEPGRFIPLAESTGIIIDYGEWAMKVAVDQFMAWRKVGLNIPRISVNLSPAQFVDENLVSTVTELVHGNKLAPGQLELEITEGAIIEKPDLARKTMEALADIGVAFAIDDFGTGHSSMANLGSFPFHRLKIDQSFVRGLVTSEADRIIVKSCIELAHKLKMDVVAEGVEHGQELNLLNNWGCDIIQGYLFNKPLSVDDFPQMAVINRFKDSDAA